MNINLQNVKIEEYTLRALRFPQHHYFASYVTRLETHKIMIYSLKTRILKVDIFLH
jgi:hypothetical protein